MIENAEFDRIEEWKKQERNSKNRKKKSVDLLTLGFSTF